MISTGGSKLLSHRALLELVENKVIDGSAPGFVNAASIDIRLGRWILTEHNYHSENKLGYQSKVVTLANKDQLDMRKHDLLARPYRLKPGEFILAQSEEVFNLPNWLAAEYKLKSSMARIGLEHLNAGWCDPGWNGSVLTLELRNMTTYHDIELHYLDKIGQMVFFECEEVAPEASYATKGRYNGDKEVTAPKVHPSDSVAGELPPHLPTLSEQIQACSCKSGNCHD